MIEIEVILDEGGILRACTASGHADAGKTGTDIVCAAVSVLMRTAVRALAGGGPHPPTMPSIPAAGSGRKGITVRYEAPEPGYLALELDYTAEGREFLSAAGVFLTEGLASVAEEYPQHCRLTIRRT